MKQNSGHNAVKACLEGFEVWYKKEQLAMRGNESKEEVLEGFHQALVEVGGNIGDVEQAVIEICMAEIHPQAIDDLSEELKEEVEIFTELLEEICKTSFEKVNFKKVFEILEEVIGEIDNKIEDLNELCGVHIQYIEADYVDFFLSHM